jgi:hypothetical protein
MIVRHKSVGPVAIGDIVCYDSLGKVSKIGPSGDELIDPLGDLHRLYVIGVAMSRVENGDLLVQVVG